MGKAQRAREENHRLRRRARKASQQEWEPELQLPWIRADRKIIAHLGPTNSGKSYHALQELERRAAAGETGLVYACPLRILAWEAYQRLQVSLGAEKVGLLTGEESHNPRAPVLCVTCEMAPHQGGLLVLDETHWLADPARGWAWTELICMADYQEIRLCGGGESLPVLRALLGEQLRVHTHQRLAPLEVCERPLGLDQVPARSVLVSFSRARALRRARELACLHGPEKVACLYGLLPMSVRREQLARVREQQALYTSCTDLLGHGVNLPCDQVIFSSLRKFDGEQERELQGWELSQLAGRAGRYGLSEGGEAGVLDEWCGGPGLAGVSRLRQGLGALLQLGEGLSATRALHRATIRPGLEELETGGNPLLLADRLRGWEESAHARLEGSLFQAQTQADALRMLSCLQQATRRHGGLSLLPLQEVWELLGMPLSVGSIPDNQQEVSVGWQLMGELARHLGGLPGPSPEQWLPLAQKGLRARTDQEVEQCAQAAVGLRWAARRLPRLQAYQETFQLAEESAARESGRRLEQQLRVREALS